MGALKWMFTFKISSSAKPTQQLTQCLWLKENTAMVCILNLGNYFHHTTPSPLQTKHWEI